MGMQTPQVIYSNQLEVNIDFHCRVYLICMLTSPNMCKYAKFHTHGILDIPLSLLFRFIFHAQ